MQTTFFFNTPLDPLKLSQSGPNHVVPRRNYTQELTSRLSLACTLVNSGNIYLAKKVAREVALKAQSLGMYIEFEAKAFLGIIAYDQGDWVGARLHFFQAKASLYPQHPSYSSDCRYIDSLLKRIDNHYTAKQRKLSLAA